jgi:hypothetical protein
MTRAYCNYRTGYAFDLGFVYPPRGLKNPAESRDDMSRERGTPEESIRLQGRIARSMA